MNEPANTRDADIFEFADLSRYSLRQRVTIRLLGLLIYLAITLIGKTIRFEPIRGWRGLDVPGYEDFESADSANKGGIIAFWHDRIFLSTYYWRNRKAAIMVSKSFDGEYITRTAQRFGYGVVRGSSSRGGPIALARMIRLADGGPRMALTVDGPRGPRYKAQKGVVLLASHTGLPIGPMLIEAKNRWIVNSWDKTQIPKPFSKAVVFFAEPVFVPENADAETIETKRQELEAKLDELVRRGEEWRCR